MNPYSCLYILDIYSYDCLLVIYDFKFWLCLCCDYRHCRQWKVDATTIDQLLFGDHGSLKRLCGFIFISVSYLLLEHTCHHSLNLDAYGFINIMKLMRNILFQMESIILAMHFTIICYMLLHILATRIGCRVSAKCVIYAKEGSHKFFFFLILLFTSSLSHLNNIERIMYPQRVESAFYCDQSSRFLWQQYLVCIE